MLSHARHGADAGRAQASARAAPRSRRAAPSSAGDEPVVDAGLHRLDRRPRCPCPSASRTRRAYAPAAPDAAQARGQRARRLRIVRHVEDHRRPARQHLEAARDSPPAAARRGCRCTATGRRSRRRIERGDRGRGVAELDTRRATPGTAAPLRLPPGPQYRHCAALARVARNRGRSRSSCAPISAACRSSARRRIADRRRSRAGRRGRCRPSRSRSPRGRRRGSPRDRGRRS